MVFLRFLGKDREAASMLDVARSGELADVIESGGKGDVFETEVVDGGFGKFLIVSGDFDFGMFAGAEVKKCQGFGKGGVEEVDFTEDDFVHRPPVHGHLTGILGGAYDLVDDV